MYQIKENPVYKISPNRCTNWSKNRCTKMWFYRQSKYGNRFGWSRFRHFQFRPRPFSQMGKLSKKSLIELFVFFLQKWHRIWGGRAAVGPKIVLHFSPALFFGRPAHFFLPHGPPVNPKWTQPQHCLKKRAHANVRYTIIFAKSGFFKNFRACGGHDASLIFWWPRQISAPCGIDSARRDLSIGAFSAHSNMSVEKFSQIQLRSRKCRKNQ